MAWAKRFLAQYLQPKIRQKEERTVIRHVAVTVTVTPPVGTRVPPRAFTRDIVLLPKAGHGWGAIGMQVSTFFVSFLVAVCAAYGTQYATLPTMDSLSAWFAPFLFGWLIESGERQYIVWGYLFGAALMVAAAVVEMMIGIKAERRSLEDIAAPLSRLDADGG